MSLQLNEEKLTKIILISVIILCGVVFGYMAYQQHISNSQCRDKGGIIIPTPTLTLNYCFNLKSGSYYY